MLQQMLLMPKHYRFNSFSCFNRLTTKRYFKIFRDQTLTWITSSSQLNSKIIYKLPWLVETSSSWWTLTSRTRKTGLPTTTRVQMRCFTNSSCSNNSCLNNTSSTRFNSSSSFKAWEEVSLAKTKLSYKNSSRCNSNSSKRTRRTSPNSISRST